MYDEKERKADEGASPLNSGQAQGGADQPADSVGTGGVGESGGLLGQTPQTGGIHNQTLWPGGAAAPEAKGLKDWHFSAVWNKALEQTEERIPQPRNNIWASELGKAKVDIYLKMRGEIPTNPPNARSLRKFEAGNLFEWIVGLVLKRAGILQEAQKWVSYQYPGLLQVTGKIDYIAGGTPDFEAAHQELERMELPKMFYRGFEAIMNHLKTNHPGELPSKPLEIKSLSAYMYDALERTGKALRIHRLQETHYLKSENKKSGGIVYICRDDMRMMEIPVILNSATEEEYRAEIEAISNYHGRDEMPPLEQPLVWDDDLKKFAKNFNVAYSGYLTKLYGLKDQAEFDDKYQPTSERWNRVLGRVKTGKKMTDKNLAVLEEIKDAGFDVDKLVAEIEPLAGESEAEIQ